MASSARIFGVASFLVLALAASGCSDDEADSGDGAATGGSQPGGDGGEGDVQPAEMTGMLESHNEARAAVVPAPADGALPELVWSSEVASHAASHAERCVFEHSSGSGYGENIYATSGSASPRDVTDSWVSEVEHYDYASNGCTRVCGHYTQVVWASSRRLGCASQKCTQNSPFGGGEWELWVCNYDPPGNYSGERPY